MFTSLMTYPERVPQALICCESELCTDKHSLVQLYPVLNDLMQSMNKVRSILHADGLDALKVDCHHLQACAVYASS